MKLSAVIVVAILSLPHWGIAISLADTPPQFSGGDGSSIAAAVVIHATRESDGIRAEYIWLREHHPGVRITNQSLVSSAGRMYDGLDVATTDGTTSKYYFDITEYFGKL